MAMTKIARDLAKQKIAAAESIDSPNAFEAGFAKLGHDIGLTESEFEQFYAKGVERLRQGAASQRK